MGIRVAVTARLAPRPLRLDGAPKQTLTRSRLLLAQHMTDDELHGLQLGGETALAMRWQHRVSTDIDYAMDRDMRCGNGSSAIHSFARRFSRRQPIVS